MRHVALLFAALIATTLFSQVIDQSNYAPAPGQVFPLHPSPFTPVPAGGDGVTWDYSGLTIGGTVSMERVDIAGTGLESLLPQATYLQNNAGSTLYNGFHVDAQGVWADGYFDTNQQLLLHFTQQFRPIAFPCVLGATWSGNFGGSYNFNGTPVGTRSGDHTGVVDGFGTLIMPFGTVTNVLRVSLTVNYVDATVAGNGSGTLAIKQYYKPGVHLDLITHGTESGVNTSGQSFSNNALSWLGDPTTATEALFTQAIGMEAWPNPASGSTTVVLGVAGDVEFRLIDASGRTVRNWRRAGLAPGIHREEIDLQGLPSGLYIMNALAGNGDRGSLRLVIE